MTPETLALLFAYIDAAIDARLARHSCGPHVAEARDARRRLAAALQSHIMAQEQ
jgi:hypothetical protein